ncbi:MAG: 30S ribosomal protein S7 [Candidatus Improbicoccus pseudotrichonymphae]|uniref:Small ribosomal subunit protein uS7 n=1 Tax=Candidatus Improbicoccus pseudotrichonymphae TaxID=3033792 RepID=A0AA48I3K8_9FIRM|nr:MAG: 30S ribosomal protein S7 [Candidatus Improbicoccus pseudotrichonymphae]
MSRRCAAKKRVVKPDAIYSSVVVSALINKVMKDGKKNIARGIVYQALEMVQSKLGVEITEILERVMVNAMPSLEVKPRRVGGSTYQVPVEVREDRRKTLALRWIVGNARKRGEKNTYNRLAGELIDTYGNVGSTVKQKENLQKMAEANKAFAHYRW